MKILTEKGWVNHTEEEMKKQDDGRLLMVGVVKGKFHKIVNTFPYTNTEISKDEFNSLKVGGEMSTDDNGEYYHFK